MKKLVGVIVALVIAGIAVSPAFAAEVNGNAGSIVKISNSCADMGNVASNNRGSIIKISGNGQCDINDILKSSAVQNNSGSIIKISNVCGDASNVASNNRGSIIKIDSNGPCKKDQPTTVVIEKPVTPVATPTSPLAPVTTSMPAELPRTGAGSFAVVLVALALATYAVTAYVSSLRTVKN